MLVLKFLVFVIGGALTFPSDEFYGILNDGELSMSDEPFSKLMKIVPSGYNPNKLLKPKKIELADHLDENNEMHSIFIEYYNKGILSKGLTFNIYDDKQRSGVIALFHLLQTLSGEELNNFTEMASRKVNEDMLEYAMRLASLYSNKYASLEKIPRYKSKPNYFINSETIRKAAHLRITDGLFYPDVAKIYQFYRTDDVLSINTNYSGWNELENECYNNLNYFREDIALNSYYYGIHMLYPFWMSDDELSQVNPRYAEHYYFVHQQLMARYLLEMQHLDQNNAHINKKCPKPYNPYLVYDNGLAFPLRPVDKGTWNEGRAFLKTIDIAIKECISRGIIIMGNGTTVNLTDENHMELLAKLIRANLDGVKGAKIVREIYGYGGSKSMDNRYNPSPSVLHHPETSLRDPVYWDLMKSLLDYFMDYKSTLEPFDLTQYETPEIDIVDAEIPKILTTFSYFEIDLEKALVNDAFDFRQSPVTLTARQRRLKSMPFNFIFTIDSKKEQEVITRIFIGPQCENNDCWSQYSQFFELDKFTVNLKEGKTNISWSPELSSQLSNDEFFHVRHEDTKKSKEKSYNIFKFPKSLIMPQGLEEGLNLTLFVMVTPQDIPMIKSNTESNRYSSLYKELDSKPLGFPFHRQASTFNEYATNYRMYKIVVFHKKSSVDRSGRFAYNLY